jgi:hypothetical protein
MKLRSIILAFPAIKSEPKLYLPVILWVMARELRLRAKVFCGCPSELCFDLQELGFVKEAIPDGLGGDFGLRHFQAWIAKRREHEAEYRSIGPTRIECESDETAIS